MGTNPEGWAAEAETEATRAIAVFEELGDERGLAEGWSLLGLVGVMSAQFGPAEEAWERAAAYAARAGVRRDELENLAWIPLVMWAGPTPVEQGLRRCVELLERSGGDKKATSSALMAQAAFEALGGHADDGARRLIGRARSLLEEVALTVWLAGPLDAVRGLGRAAVGRAASAQSGSSAGATRSCTRSGSRPGSRRSPPSSPSRSTPRAARRRRSELTRESEESAGAEDAYSHALSAQRAREDPGPRARRTPRCRLASESVAWPTRPTSSTSAGMRA